FEVQAADQTLVRAAVADSGLASFFVGQADPVLAAHHLLADLAQIYGDAPNDRGRGVVVVAPSSWLPDPSFLSALLGGLQARRVLAAVTVDSYFDQVPAGLPSQGAPLIRPIVTNDGAIRAAATGLLPEGQRSARADLQAVAALLPPSDTSVYPR